MRRGYLALLALVAAAAACHAFGTGTPDPVTANDGGTLVPGAPDSAASSGYCASSPDATLCTDFDGPDAADPLAGWTPEFPPGRPLELVDAAFSQPYALATGIPATALGSETPGSRLELDVPLAAAKRTRITFKVKLAPIDFDAGGQVTLCEILCSLGAGSFNGALIGVRSDYSVGLDDSSGRYTALTKMRPGDWTTFQIDVTWGPGAHAVFTMNGAAIGDGTPVTDCPAIGQKLTLKVGLGSYTHEAANAVYDDILYELNP